MIPSCLMALAHAAAVPAAPLAADPPQIAYAPVLNTEVEPSANPACGATGAHRHGLSG